MAMTNEEIQDIKDKAAREVDSNCDSFKDAFDWFADCSIEDYEAINKIIDHAIELASKREIKVPDVGEIEKYSEAHIKRGDFDDTGCISSSKEDGANWAIERIKELNK